MMGRMNDAVRFPAGLAAALRQDTKALHAQAERAGIMPALLHGHLPLADYRRLLRNLHALYAALEPALLRHRDHPCVAPICFPALFREAALADDLAMLGERSAPADSELDPVALAYRRRLEALDAHDPALLVAHAYVRYLGDLSGGQILARIVAKTYDLADGRGTRFYQFGPADRVAAHAQALRAGLDSVPVDAAGRQRIVDEAQRAFQRHADLFTHLAA
jgi:heme oxygenase